MFSQEEANSHQEELVRRRIAWIWGMVPASSLPEGPLREAERFHQEVGPAPAGGTAQPQDGKQTPYLDSMLEEIPLDQEELLEELLREGMMCQEDADCYRELYWEMQEGVREGMMTHEEAGEWVSTRKKFQ